MQVLKAFTIESYVINVKLARHMWGDEYVYFNTIIKSKIPRHQKANGEKTLAI